MKQILQDTITLDYLNQKYYITKHCGYNRYAMTIITAFELGLWNAWIFILPVIFAPIFGSRMLGRRKSEESSGVTKGKTSSMLYFSIVILSYAYSVFLPLKLDTILLVIGLLIYLPAIFFLIAGLLIFATTRADALVTKGAYGISRNPSYVSAFFINIGIGVACFSWVFLLVAIVDFLLLGYDVVIVEEPFLLENYGDRYREYMKRTPRWIGIPKSERKQS